MYGGGGVESADLGGLPSDPGSAPAAAADDAAAGGADGKSDDAARPTAHASRDDASGNAAGTGNAGRGHAETSAFFPRPTRPKVTRGVAPRRGGR